MALKKIRLVWGRPPLAGGRWRLGLFNLQELAPTTEEAAKRALPGYWKKYLHHALHVSGSGLLAWGASAATAGYFAAAAALLQRLENANPHNQVGYADLVLPHRWPELDRLRAKGWALQSRDLLKQGDFLQGLELARLALARDPSDHENREQVARLFLAMRLVPLARQTLRDGLAQGYPGRKYLALAFSLARDGDNPKAWVELVEQAQAAFEALPPEERLLSDARFLQEQTVHALSADRRFGEALVRVGKYYPAGDPLRRELAALDHLENKRPDEAMAVLADWIAARPEDPEPRRLLVRAAREKGDHAAMDQAFTGLRALDSSKIDTLFYGIVQNQLAGRLDRADAIYEETMLRFGAEEALPAPFALVLAQAGLTDLLGRLEQDLRERGLSLAPIHSARLQIAVTRGDWPEVRRLVGLLRPAGREGARAQKDERFLGLMEKLATACLDDGQAAQSALVDAMAQRPGTLKSFYLALDSLEKAGRPQTAARILTLAEGPYPDGTRIASIRARVETELAALAQARSDAEPVRVADDTLKSFELFRAAFDARLGAGDAEAALALIVRARRGNPYWLGDHDARLEEMELPLRAASDDVLSLQLLARRKLGRGGNAAEELLALAGRLHAETRKENALLLVKEVIRDQPANTEALRLLHAWQPRPADATAEAS